MVLGGARESGFYLIPLFCLYGATAAMCWDRSVFIKLSVTNIQPQIEFGDMRKDVNNTLAI